LIGKIKTFKTFEDIDRTPYYRDIPKCAGYAELRLVDNDTGFGPTDLKAKRFNYRDLLEIWKRCHQKCYIKDNVRWRRIESDVELRFNYTTGQSSDGCGNITDIRHTDDEITKLIMETKNIDGPQLGTWSSIELESYDYDWWGIKFHKWEKTGARCGRSIEQHKFICDQMDGLVKFLKDYDFA
jgi:hypothetical protein